jgi:hypothetical protein
MHCRSSFKCRFRDLLLSCDSVFFCDFGSLVEVSKLPCGLHSCSVFQSSVVVAASRFEALYVFSAVDYDKAFDTWNLVFRNPK